LFDVFELLAQELGPHKIIQDDPASLASGTLGKMIPDAS
jgi:hypothetical protein